MRGRGINTDDSEFLNKRKNAETTLEKCHPNAIYKLLFSSV